MHGAKAGEGAEAAIDAGDHPSAPDNIDEFADALRHDPAGFAAALADPAADWPCCLIALGASVRIAGRNGIRVHSVADFIKGPYETALTTGDLIMGFDIPAPREPLRWGFAKVARKSGANSRK